MYVQYSIEIGLPWVWTTNGVWDSVHVSEELDTTSLLSPMSLHLVCGFLGLRKGYITQFPFERALDVCDVVVGKRYSL